VFTLFKIFKKRLPPEARSEAASGLGLSNFDQEAVLAAHRKRSLQLPTPVVIPRNPKPNSPEEEAPVVMVMTDKLPDLGLPAFRYLKFKR
jgi:hypothetical protein